MSGLLRSTLRLSKTIPIIQRLYAKPNVFIKNVATQNDPTERNDRRNRGNLERSLRRLDEDVRRTGRISRRDIEEVLSEIRNTRSASSSQALLIIRCCGNLVPEELADVRTKLVQDIWETFTKMGIPLDISHYNALLRVYLENEYDFSPTEFLADLEAKGIAANRVTYQRLINRYCQSGDIEGATKILQFMKDKSLPVSENVFNALILGHSQTGDMESAEGIINVMAQAGITPGSETYATLMCGYAKNGQIDKLKHTLNECEQKDLEIQDRDLMDIIYELSMNGNDAIIGEFLAKMRKSFGYNQDAINLILKLLNHEKVDAALQVLQTMQSRDDANRPKMNGLFFIRHLVKTGQPTATLVDVCSRLKETGINDRGLLIAVEVALQEAQVETSIELLKIHKKSSDVRPHYFWPLIVKQQNEPDLIALLSTMINDFELSINSETLREYVIPQLLTSTNAKIDKIILTLNETGVPTGTAAANAVYYLLSAGKLTEAGDVAQKYNAFYSPFLVRQNLPAAFLKSKDLDAFVRIVRAVSQNYSRKTLVLPGLQKNDDDDFSEAKDSSSTETGSNTPKESTPAQIVGMLLYDACNMIRDDLPLVERVLSQIVDEGLSISEQSAERIQQRLGERITPNISNYLSQLTSGELTPVPQDGPQKRSVFSAVSTERFIKTLEEKSETATGLKRQLLTLYCRNRDLEKTEALLETLTKENFEFSPGLHAQLAELYTHHERLDKVMEHLNVIKTLDPNFCIDDMKVVKVMELMVKHKKVDEACEFVMSQPRDRKLAQRSFPYNQRVWRMLTSLADEGCVEDLRKITEVLLQKDYIDATNVMLGPLVKVSLVNDNLREAIETFEQLARKYKVTPWKNELTCKLIQKEDADSLQKITDLSTDIHGEVNSLYDLVFAFIDCGRVRQARKILETPGLRNRQQKMNNFCELKSNDGEIDPLEGLVEATRDLNYIDRANIFYHLLQTYIKKNDVEKSMGLWTRMQEENVQPSDPFLHDLHDFLSANNVKVPFTVPKKTQSNIEESGENQVGKRNVLGTAAASRGRSETNAREELEPLTGFRRAIRQNALDVAMELKASVDKQLTLTDKSHLIELLVQESRLGEAKKIVDELLKGGMYPLPRMFGFFLRRLADAGDYKTIEEFGNRVNDDVKRLISYDNRLCHAYVSAGLGKKVLDKLETEIDTGNKDVVELEKKFPRGGIMGILESDAGHVAQFERIAEKYLAKGIKSPINLLWVHYLIHGRLDIVEDLWTKHLSTEPRLMFQRVLQVAREKNDRELIERLLGYLTKSKINQSALGNAYSCLLDVLVESKQLDEALECVKHLETSIGLENVNKTALSRVQSAAESSGKAFPFKIPGNANENDKHLG